MLYKIPLLLLIPLCLMACSGGGSGSPAGLSDNDSDNYSDNDSENYPNIAFVQADVAHSHESFDGKWAAPLSRDLRFAVATRVSDPLGLQNIRRIYVHRSADDRVWPLLDTDWGSEAFSCYEAGIDVFECQFHDSSNVSSLPVRGWELVVVNKQGLETRTRFAFALPGGNDATLVEHIYADTYSGNTDAGVSALEALTIARNTISVTADAGSQSFRIAFTATDARAQYYSFVFYGAGPAYDYIGRVALSSSSLTSMALVPGQLTEVSVPWSEVEMKEGYHVNNIAGMHIKLYDQPVEWMAYDGYWFQHLSYSEFIPLTMP